MKLYYLPFIICIFLFIFLYNHSSNIENFRNTYDVNKSSTVNLPINTTYSCSNVCGPLNRCSITGEQCSSDIDCYGCQVTSETSFINSNKVEPNNEAGKLTSSFTPTYSILTTDIGTTSKQTNSNDIPVQYFKGVDMWRDSFNKGMSLFVERSDANAGSFITFSPTYPKRTTLSGDFTVVEPPASNI
jgi:hypothetical protein